MAVCVRLYGPVSWVVDGEELLVRGQTRTDVLVMLAEAAGAIVSVDAILDRLWDERPQSGENAVQRHISGLRSELSAAGVDAPRELIQRHRVGYRLVPSVRTDLDQMAVVDSDETAHHPHWWHEPLVGATWDLHRPLHARLCRLAVARARALVGAESIDLRLVRDRFGSLLLHTPAREEVIDLCLDRAISLPAGHTASGLADIAAASLHVDDAPELYRRVGQLGADSSAGMVAGFTAEAAELVEQCLGLWQRRRAREALDVLDAASGTVGDDLERRLYRWLVWLPEDPWVTHAFSLIPRSSISPQRGDERMICSVDARCLMHIPDGDRVANAEVVEARSIGAPQLVRALRVRYMFGLGRPHDANQDAVVDELAALDSSRDAVVEAARFRFVSAVRRGAFDECEALLEELESAVASCWPGSGDDFAAMARASLSRSTDPAAHNRFEVGQQGNIRFLADGFVVDMADTCQALLDPDRAMAVQDTSLYSTVAYTSGSCGTALRLIRDLARGERVEDLAHALALRLPATVKEMQFAMLPVALTLVAERYRNREVAAAAAEAISPWSGQMLGLWPIDFVIGPADHWLDRLASV